VKMGIRDNRYEALVPQVVGELRLKGRVHAMEAQLARAHTQRRLKFTLPGPMTIVDTVADRHYGADREGRIRMAFAFADLLGQEGRQYEQVFPALAKSSIDQVSLECIHSHVPPDLMRLLDGKDVMVGAIDVASDAIETPEEVAETIGTALRFVARERIFPCTNCGMAPMRREVAERKLA